MSEDGRQPKAGPRHVAEGAGRALQRQLGQPPQGTFADGVEAHVAYRRMTPDSEGACELGDYVPTARPDDGNGNGAVHLDGEAPRAIRFPAWFRAWFAKQNQRTLRVLDRLIGWLDEHGEEEAERRLADLDEVIDRHRARKRLVARVAWASKYAAPAAGITWGAVTFASDKVGRLVEQLPVLRAAWKAIMGPT